MNEQLNTVQLFAPSLTALYACQHAWEKYKFYFWITSPSFYAGWREEPFCRESTTDSKILRRMDVLEKTVTPKRYVLFHEPEGPKQPVREHVTIPKWVLPAGVALVLVGGVWMLSLAAAATAVMAPVAFAAVDPAVVAELEDGTWIEIGWWWDG